MGEGGGPGLSCDSQEGGTQWPQWGPGLLVGGVLRHRCQSQGSASQSETCGQEDPQVEPRRGQAGNADPGGWRPGGHPYAPWLLQGDYENVVPESPEDEGIHYSELVHLGIGERPLAQEMVEYVTLKH